MKSIFFLLAVLFLMGSCNSNRKKGLAEKRKADSILVVQQLERENFLADSLAKAARLDQAMTAFGELKFGMSRDTVKEIMKRTLNQGNSKTLGACQYSFSPTFNDAGQLYMLQLQTDSESSLHLESSVRAKVENLKEIITTKYDKPKKSFGYPDDFAFVETQLQWTDIWEFGTKTIKIGVASIPKGSRYKAICWIYDDPLRVKQLNKGKDMLNSKIEKAASDF
ncbi:MAG: hypothetical protein Q8N05_02210 [Bacteroidota bacterium]|nr:hypothetical protein [Bacteroidota bacterium]